ncbi:hypothetical protein E2C01_007848 [Portunus trituberculatus]|uniref:Uncharacterized protein n=1 Tax=Portunus trituberculatus TaxID=210409 RepID=A0A5B7D3G8_PORTR|nr:hypothetical protein [Portunus trituberculatus]
MLGDIAVLVAGRFGGMLSKGRRAAADAVIVLNWGSEWCAFCPQEALWTPILPSLHFFLQKPMQALADTL